MLLIVAPKIHVISFVSSLNVNLCLLLSAKTYSNQKKEWAELWLGSSALFGYL